MDTDDTGTPNDAPFDRDALLTALRALRHDPAHDGESGPWAAVGLLLRYIDDAQIEAEFEAVERWINL